MTFKIYLPILMMALSAIPALSQDLDAAVLSDIITSLGGGSPSAGDAAKGTADALDMIGQAASPLDYITASADNSDPYAALAGVFNRQNSASSIGVLDMITGAYNGSGYYMSGVFDYMDPASYGQAATVIPPIGGIAYYSPEWGRITSGFGYRPQFKRMHKGIDIAMSVGDTVRVALPGVVERVAYEAKGYGHYIIVRHDDGMETRYAHLSSALVGVGQRVQANEAIALSGNTGNSTGPHLHFETRYQGVAVDPTSVFNFLANPQPAVYDAPAATSAPATLATGFNGSKKSLESKSTYVVRQGDTPKKIANRAGISVFRFCQLNFITENQKLEPGTMVKLR